MSEVLCACGCGRPTKLARRTDPRNGWVKGEPLKYLRGHSGHKWAPGYGAKSRLSLPPNWTTLLATSAQGCWLWQGRINDGGYALYGAMRVHRLTYESFIGIVPEGLVLDHVCHSTDLTCRGGPTCIHRRCVNPFHLDPVTHAENVRRGRAAEAAVRTAAKRTHCPHGHPWSPENTLLTERQRICRECRRQASSRNNARRRGKASAA